MSVYDDVAGSWARSATRVYGPLAEQLVASSPLPLDGRQALDVGSGTGAVARAAAAAGALVVAVDRSRGMAAHQGSRPWPVAVGDVLALPFSTGSVDVALAGFLVNHLPPELALREMARTVRPGGAVLVTAWVRGTDPVKAAIDGVLSSHGWTAPSWYRTMKAEVEPISGDPDRLEAAAVLAGLVEVHADVRLVDLGTRDPRVVVAYRLCAPQIAPWVASLVPASRLAVTDELVDAVSPLVARWRPGVVFANGRVRGQSTSAPAARSRVPA